MLGSGSTLLTYVNGQNDCYLQIRTGRHLPHNTTVPFQLTGTQVLFRIVTLFIFFFLQICHLVTKSLKYWELLVCFHVCTRPRRPVVERGWSARAHSTRQLHTSTQHDSTTRHSRNRNSPMADVRRHNFQQY